MVSTACLPVWEPYSKESGQEAIVAALVPALGWMWLNWDLAGC
jgi:hypothetical protein